jgi:hypothetical protein
MRLDKRRRASVLDEDGDLTGGGPKRTSIEQERMS